MNKCRLCGLIKPLLDSHSIPNSYFKAIFRKNNGKGVLLSAHDDPNHKSSNSGDWKLLCKECEQEINTGCEKYAINKFRYKRGAIESSHSIRFSNVDCAKIVRFCVAILWRASISPADLFRGFKLDDKLESIFKNYLKSNSNNIDEKLFSIYIYKLFDPKDVLNKFDSSFIMAPVTHNRKDFDFHQFVVEGFLFNISTPSLRHKDRNNINLIKSNHDFIISPRRSWFEEKELVKFLAASVHREQTKRELEALKSN